MNATEFVGLLEDVRVAMFANAYSGEPKEVELGALFGAMRGSKYAEKTRRARKLFAAWKAVCPKLDNKKSAEAGAYEGFKKTLPAFCVSGTARSRTEPLVHSGLLQVDCDKLNGALDNLRERLKSDKHVAFGFVSPSGDGLKLGLRIDGTRHAESFQAAQSYFLDTYGLEIDPAVKDRLRLCFVSHDPELWTREDAEPLPIPEPPADERASVETGEDDPSACAVRGDILRILTGDAPLPTKRSSVAGAVVRALCGVGQFYFHAERRNFDSALFFNLGTRRLERVRSDAFQSWLSSWLGVNRADALFKYAQADVETFALSGKLTAPVLPEMFWAARAGAVYISNGDGSAYRIRPGQVALVDNGVDGVLFAAGRTLTPWQLTDPRDPLTACKLFSGASAIAAHGMALFRLWAYSLPTNPRSKPPLVLSGEVGSGKTRLARGIAELYGLPFVAAKVEEGAEDDFWPNMDAGGIFTLDNADTRCRWLPDALAAAATDGCAQRRKLYTNSETVTLRARAWVAVTTANPTFAGDVGLADRLLLVRMVRREGQTSDSELSDDIAQNRDAGLSHIAHALAVALADTNPVPGELNARHPDFAAFAVRIGRALGSEVEAVAALQAAEADKALFCLENDPIGAALVAHVATTGQAVGTAADLLPALVAVDPELGDWLKPKKLGKRLSALWPHVKARFPKSKKALGRLGATEFSIRAESQSAGFAGFQEAIPEKSPRERV